MGIVQTQMSWYQNKVCQPIVEVTIDANDSKEDMGRKALTQTLP